MKAESAVRYLLLVMIAWLPLGGVSADQEATELERPPGDRFIQSEGSLRFFVDTAGFLGPSGRTRQEFYILIDTKQLVFSRNEDVHVAKMEITTTVLDSACGTVASRSTTRTVSVGDPKHLDEASAPFKDLVAFDLSPGFYRVRLHIHDIHSDTDGRSETKVVVRDFRGDNLVISDILFATELKRTTHTDRFEKNGWKVVPNTTRSYVEGQPLNLYFEIYHLLYEEDAPDPYFNLGYSLLDTAGNVVKRYPAKHLLKPGNSCVKTEELETGDVPSGTYYFQIEAFDKASGSHTRLRRLVSITSPQAPASLTQVEQDQLRYYSHIRYLASEKQLREYRELQSVEERMQFLRGFWRGLDPTPDTPKNERLLEHMRRIRFVENHFVSGYFGTNSDSDKGRVYIKYGPPDDIQYNTAANDQKPFEIWTYEQSGRYVFVFRDRRGDSTFELVNSTYPGELYNPNWQRDF